ncbi:MAG: choice-of-anchor J domain-containing protein [Prevotellaceae bacterium]|jgi:hypothetical protein|nr:choice-of-anchor J domain-containing protein [Prevotellaceae bacterium]
MKKLLILSLYVIGVCAASCSEREKDDKFVVAPTEGATSLSETFESLALDAKAASLSGWSELYVAGGASWKIAGAGGNRYAEISAEAEPNATCETWLLTPALDLKKAPNKTLTFSTQGEYWRENSSLEVYLLPKLSTDDVVKLSVGEAPDYVRIAKKEDAAGTWIPSGDIDLSAYAATLDIVYVAFRYAATGGADNSTTFRIDNVTLGDAGGDAGGDDTGVAALSEDFESFKEGTGDAYMSAQPDSKGWKGLRVQGTLEPDVRLFNGNKYVHLSAHRNAIKESSVQEFWLISPALDVSAAAVKSFSFDVSAGYYNSSTVFEVYAMDGSNPLAANKTKLAWSEPVSIPPSSYGAFASSGSIDLSGYSGVKYVGFYYRGNSGTGNSTTYQVDNFVFGSGAPSVPVLKFTSAASLSVIVGDELSHTFALEEKNLTGETAVSCSNLPDWLTLAGRMLTGTPPAAGKYELDVTATNGGEAVTQTFTITVIEAPAIGSNLLLNGGFEEFTEATPTGWSAGSGVNNNPVEKIAAGAKAGSFAVKLAANANGRCDLKQTVLGVVAGATYTVSFWYKNNTKGADNQGIRLWANFLKEDGSTIKPDAGSLLQPDNTLAAASDWTLFTLDVVAPSDAARFNFEVRATKNQSGEVDECFFGVKN